MPFNRDALKQLVEFTGMSVRQLENETNIGRASISRYLSGEVSPQAEQIDKMYEFSRKVGAWHLEFYERPIISNPPKNIGDVLKNIGNIVERQ